MCKPPKPMDTWSKQDSRTYAICSACRRDLTPTPFAIAAVRAAARSLSNRDASALLTKASCCAAWCHGAIRHGGQIHQLLDCSPESSSLSETHLAQLISLVV